MGACADAPPSSPTYTGRCAGRILRCPGLLRGNEHSSNHRAMKPVSGSLSLAWTSA